MKRREASVQPDTLPQHPFLKRPASLPPAGTICPLLAMYIAGACRSFLLLPESLEALDGCRPALDYILAHHGAAAEQAAVLAKRLGEQVPPEVQQRLDQVGKAYSPLDPTCYTPCLLSTHAPLAATPCQPWPLPP